MAIELHEFMLKAEQNLRFWDNKKKNLGKNKKQKSPETGRKKRCTKLK